MAKGKNTNARSLEFLRDAGIEAGKVECWIPARGGMRHGRRRDLFGIVDIVGLPESPVGHRTLPWWVQSTTGGEVVRHAQKALESPHLPALVRSGRFLILGWRKLKGRGRRQWWPRVVEVLEVVDRGPPERSAAPRVSVEFREWDQGRVEALIEKSPGE